MSSFKDLRIVDNFYQTSLFFPMPTVIISTLTEDGMTECAWYPESRILLVMNNTPDSLETEVRFPLGALTVSLNPFEMKFVPV